MSFWYLSCLRKTPLSDQAGVSIEARGLNFGLSVYLLPYFVYLSGKISCESARLHRLTLAIIVGNVT